MFDVAIVGYGPAGATLAKLLGQAGLSVLVLEKDAQVYPLPRAIHFDGEVMRVFQSAGLRREVEAVSRPGLKPMHFVNAAGEVLLLRGGTTLAGPHGCASNYYFHQPELEAVLRAGVARHPGVQVRLQCEALALREAGDHVEIELRDARTGATGTERARYVVGCDGARSLARRTIGTAMTDLGLHQPWLVFDLVLNDDAPAMPDHTVQHCDPARPMTYCCVTGRRRRWEVMLMPGDDPERMVQPATIWQLVAPWLAPAHARIERAVIYTFHSLVAQTWRRGRLLLAGDAAHQTPPFLGQGMCAAIRDAANLAWKLEAVLRGRAGDALLDTYGSERSPHVQAFIELAVKLGDIIQITDPGAAAERDEKFRSGGTAVFEFPSPGLGSGLGANQPAPAGQPFPQPTLPGGRLLDEVLGHRFAVIAHEDVARAASDASIARWRRWNASVLCPADGPLREWLDSQGVAAIIVRPDRYILGTARDAGELDALSALLP